MLPLRASRAATTLTRRTLRFSSSTTSTGNTVPANDPNPSARPAPTSATNATATSARGQQAHSLQETPEAGEAKRVMQAPNRSATWSRSQQPRELAMAGPRFEQTVMEDQPRPLAAIDLIHQQPVTWTNKRVVSCDGGGGPLGHPRIFINVDKPKICWCTYCGLPFAHEHHRKHLQSLPSTTYPLEPTPGNNVQIPAAHYGSDAASTGATTELQSNTGRPLEQR